MDNQLKKLKTAVKSDKSDASVTWTSFSDVCSEILKAADVETKCPVEKPNPIGISKPLAGGGNKPMKVTSVGEDAAPIITDVQNDNVSVFKKTDEQNKVQSDDKAQLKTIISEKSDADCCIVPVTVSCSTESDKEAKEHNVQGKHTPLPYIGSKRKHQIKKRVDASATQLRGRLFTNCVTFEKEEAAKNGNRKDSKIGSKSSTPYYAKRVVAKALSRTHSNLLSASPSIQALTKSRKRKTVSSKEFTYLKRAKIKRFPRAITTRGLYSTPIISPKKPNSLFHTPLKMRKQKLSVPRHLRPFLSKLQFGGSGIKQLIRCREKLDLLRVIEWEKRLVCLDCISNIVAVGDVSESELAEEMRQLKKSLKKNLEDLRSRITICVTETIMIAADFLGNRFLPFFTFLFPTLCKGLYVTIRIIKESNDRCITECVKAITEPRILKTLLDQRFIRDQHREVKFKTGSMLTDFFNRFLLSIEGPKTEISEITFAPYRRHTKELLKAVKLFSSDQNKSVRKMAKELLDALKVCLSEKDISDWMATLSYDIKRRLQH